MNELPLLAQGWLLGFAIAAPVGPIGVLCIRRTLADGRLIGFLSGLGAASADMLYGAVAAFGLTAVQSLLVSQQGWLQVIGGLFLAYLGVRTFRTQPADHSAATVAPHGKLSAYLTTFVLTLTNPATILSFVFIFAGTRLGRPGGGYGAAGLLVLGVFMGSASWWFLLSGVVSLLRHRFNSTWMLWVNRIAGLIIFAFGVVALALL